MTYPIYINAMTGGSEWTKQINEKLAVVARETGLAMAVGSTHAALRNPKMAESFSIARQTNPEGIIFSNVGADVPVDKAVEAVSLLDAQALQIHVNAPQELVMPEGNREFSTWLDNVAAIVQRVDVPVIIKEVGFGMSKELYKDLIDVGVTYVDVSGGTNFVTIENERRSNKDMDYLANWGQSTVESLLESSAYQDSLNVFASGGVRTPLDVVKSLALGAKAVGMSRPFLNQVENGGITTRRSNKDMDYLANWGQSTVESLLESSAYQDSLNVFASGGVRTPLDVVKSLALGAKAVGMSRPF